MKIVSWNINGLRSMKKEVSTILAELDADIACFQETKITSKLVSPTALINCQVSQVVEQTHHTANLT